MNEIRQYSSSSSSDESSSDGDDFVGTANILVGITAEVEEDAEEDAEAEAEAEEEDDAEEDGMLLYQQNQQLLQQSQRQRLQATLEQKQQDDLSLYMSNLNTPFARPINVRPSITPPQPSRYIRTAPVVPIVRTYLSGSQNDTNDETEVYYGVPVGYVPRRTRRLADAPPLPIINPRIESKYTRRLGISQEEQDNINGIPCPLSGQAYEAKATILQCVICRHNQIQTVNFPCMHACFCLECVRPSVMHSNICPQCRTQYMNVSMLYLVQSNASINDLVEHVSTGLSSTGVASSGVAASTQSMSNLMETNHYDEVPLASGSRRQREDDIKTSDNAVDNAVDNADETDGQPIPKRACQSDGRLNNSLQDPPSGSV